VNVESTARTIPDPCPYASDADVWALCGPAQCDSCAIGSAYSSSSLGVAVEPPNLHELLTNPVSCGPWHQKQPSPPVEAAAHRMAFQSCRSAYREPAGERGATRVRPAFALIPICCNTINRHTMLHVDVQSLILLLLWPVKMLTR
jgi:hypothetical protein